MVGTVTKGQTGCSKNIRDLAQWHPQIRQATVSCVQFRKTMSSILFFSSALKASGGDGIPVELFQILKDDAVKALHSICQQIWKTQQWPQDWKRSVFIPTPKKGNAKECSTTTATAAATAKSLQSCPTLCDPTDGSPPGSPVPGTLQARTLEWVAMSFSNA